MTQQRRFAYVATVVALVLALVIALRIWWRFESPVPRVNPPAGTAGTTPPAPVAPAATPHEPALTPEDPPREASPPGAALSLSGRVCDTVGRPIPGAVVTCAGEDVKEVRSDREGRYRIEGLPERIFALTAAHPAYFPDQNPLVAAGAAHVDFVLPIRASIEIEAVRGDTREPLVWYFVQFRHTAEVRFGVGRDDGRGGGFGAKVDDPAGKTVIADLEPVAGVLRVYQEAYVEQEIPISAEELANTPHTVAVALEPSRDGLEGIVVDSRGTPIEGAYVVKGRMSWADDLPGKSDTRTGPDGRFRMEPPDEPREDVVAWHPAYAPAYVTIYPNASPRELLRIVLHGMATVRGRVTLDGEPLEKCHVVAFFKGEPALDENGKHTGADGAYELRGLPPGLVSVEARVDEAVWGANGVHVARTAELAEGRVTPVDFELQRGTGTLEGRITCAWGPVEDGGIMLSLETGQGNARYEVSADDDHGEGAYYRLENVLPGTGILTVGAAVGSEVFARVTRQEVTIPPGGRVVRDISFSAGGGVAGRVSNGESCDIVGVVALEGESSLTADEIVYGIMQNEADALDTIPVAAFTLVSGGIFGSGKENPTGEYALPPLDPGRYTVLAIGLEKDTFASDRAFVTLRDGQTETVNLTLRK